MKTLKSLICMICASFLLVGCSYFDTGEGVDVSSGPPAERIDLMAGGSKSADAQGFAANAREFDLMDMADNASDANVRVFSLDREPPANHIFNRPPASVAPAAGSAGIYKDSGVEVFPLSGGIEPPRWTKPSVVSPGRGASSWGSPYRPLLPEPNRGGSGFQSVSEFDSMVRSYGELSEEGPLPSRNFVTILSADKPPVKIYFDQGSAFLTEDASRKIEQIAQDFDPSFGEGLGVEGYASVTSNIDDVVQRKVVNLKISMDRAFNVTRRLIEAGVPAEAVRTLAWGESRLARSLAASSPESLSGEPEMSPIYEQ